MKKRMLFAIVLVLVLLVLGAPILTPQPVEAACPARGTGLAGAYNMMRSDAMASYVDNEGPMSKNNPLGNDGMIRAVLNSACP